MIQVGYVASRLSICKVHYKSVSLVATTHPHCQLVTSLLPAERMLMTGRSLTVRRPAASLLMTRLRPPTVLTGPAWLQSGALSLVGIVKIVLSLVESFKEMKYFHDVATPALLCHKEPARRIQSPLLLLSGSLWHKG